MLWQQIEIRDVAICHPAFSKFGIGLAIYILPAKCFAIIGREGFQGFADIAHYAFCGGESTLGFLAWADAKSERCHFGGILI